ncbi:hypothetical protein PTSG_00339 [Salpingoeca rosetta]|uniref:F-box domain-containing protein n=1 Tax=Salpingoeca rosetta (strain ATCC 50818 / BSB-021) TaxID=946362 RepID=F2TW74_SALR5|nr:uncharacterized protein PTSG_00339 [Salpingoeca rosetta]EGD72320.1 hypothetical protein PTSG_00339 [Salpingoeca rosetta]|eukprot:XP_004998890.1 hypothetical protein PTSG_00339 [Salpingoeca rosetta]
MAEAQLLDLPGEVLENVLRFLDLMSLYATALQCRALNALRWPIMDLRNIPMHKLTQETFRYIVERRKPEVLLLTGVLGCPRSAMPFPNVEAIAHSKSLRHLGLEAAYVGDEGIRALSAVLPFLDTLNLKFNNITGKGAAALGAALPSAHHLQSLDLSGNPICDSAGMEDLCMGLSAAKGLRVLTLRDVRLKGAGTTALGKLLVALPTLHELDLSRNPIGDSGMDNIAKGLAACTSLRTLTLANVQLNNDGVVHLASAIQQWPNRSLRQLDLADNTFSSNLDALGLALAQQESLQRVSLAGCNLQRLPVASVAALLSHCGSAVVDLRRCRISDDSCTNIATALADGASPSELELSSNACAFASMQQLGLAMASNTTTTVLKLNFNSLGDSGMRALCRGLMSNTALRVLHVADNNCGGAGVEALAKYVAATATLRELDLSGNQLMGNAAACAALGRALRDNSSIATLHMCSVGLLGSDVTAMVDAWLSPPAPHPATATTETAPPTADTAAEMAQQPPQGDEEQAARPRNQGESQPQPPAQAQQQQQEEEALVSPPPSVPATTHVRVTPTLKKFNLAGNELEDEGATAIARLLMRDTTHIRDLDLSGNMIASGGVDRIATALATNTRLRRLRLRNNNIGAAGAAGLGKALSGESMCALELLDLSRNQLCDEGTVQLCLGLQGNAHIKCLSLAHNCIANRGAEALGTLLGLSTALECLSIEDNKMDCTGVAAITIALQQNLRLREINMRNVGVDTETCPLPPRREGSGSNRYVRVIASHKDHCLHQKALEHLPDF